MINREKLCPVIGQVLQLLGCVAVPASLTAQIPMQALPTSTAFVHVTVIPMDRERVLTDQTVVVRDGRIAALGPATRVPVPSEAEEIDGHGKFLMPGLGDMHAHIMATDEPGLFLALANGVTTIRDMGDGRALQALREARARGVVLPPRIYGIGRMGDCRPQETLRDCLTAMKAAGVDLLKLYDDYGSAERLDSILAITKEIGLPVGGHAMPLGIVKALQIPYKSIEHLLGYASAVVGSPVWPEDGGTLVGPPKPVWLEPNFHLNVQRLRELADATRQAGAWNAPTLLIQGVLEPMATTPEKKFAVRRYQQFIIQIIKALHRAGARLLLSEDVQGSPTPAGFAVHGELAILVEQVGLTPYQALETGTQNVARYLHLEDSTGTVAVGKWADLVLLDGNPLRNIHYASSPAGVMAAGRWFSRAVLEARLDSLEARGCRLAELRHVAAEHRTITFEQFDAIQHSAQSCP